jgi:hypothetical protein
MDVKLPPTTGWVRLHVAGGEAEIMTAERHECNECTLMASLLFGGAPRP